MSDEEPKETVTDAAGHPLDVPAQPPLLGEMTTARGKLAVERARMAEELLAQNPELTDDDAWGIAATRLSERPSGIPDDMVRRIAARRDQERADLQEKYERVLHALEEIASILETDYDEQARYHAWEDLRTRARGTIEEWGHRVPQQRGEGMRPA